MLIILAWHQIHSFKHGICPEKFKDQLLFLKNNFKIVSDPASKEPGMKVLLTFDDATVDFYLHAFPILQELNLPATLAVPTAWIPNFSNLSADERLNLLKTSNPFLSKEAFCTIAELKELKTSNLIRFAAHGHNHHHLKTHPQEDEVLKPKAFFKEYLDDTLDTFIFPYGATSNLLLPLLKKEYKNLIRIGTASNTFPSPTYYYRIIMDRVPSIESIFTKKSILKLICKESFNRLRKH